MSEAAAPRTDTSPVVNRGANGKCPGRAPWHIKRQGHELRAWVLAMHFLEAMELAADMIETNRVQELITAVAHLHESSLPEPASTSGGDFVSLRFGVVEKQADSGGNSAHRWHFHRVSCRTSFSPVVQGELKEVVQSTVHAQTDILHGRDDSLIEKGWVWDVGELERKTKLKVEQCGGLGYIDMKLALYGIKSSGKLSLWLPSQVTNLPVSSTSNDARSRFKSLVICEVNEKRRNSPCDMDKDITLIVGGKETNEVKKMAFTGVEYLGFKVCIHVGIPIESKLSTKPESGQQQLGLPIDVHVTNAKLTKTGACSIAHVVWEELD